MIQCRHNSGNDFFGASGSAIAYNFIVGSDLDPVVQISVVNFLKNPNDLF